MPHHNTVFRQVSNRLPWSALRRSVARHQADKGVRCFGTEALLQSLLLAQVSGAGSLRDVEALLQSQDARRYHSGLPRVARSTLADALASRPAGVFADVLSQLIGRLMASLPREVGQCVRLIDSTTLPLNSLSTDWAHCSTKLCGAKAHVVYAPDADCPVYFGFSPARVSDIAAARAMPIEPGCTYVFDLGYYDYAWWKALDAAGCRIVTRLKANTPLHDTQTLALPPGEHNVLTDTVGRLPARQAKNRKNPFNHPVRELLVRQDNGKCLRLVTNDLHAPATQIAALYKRRWAIELFFRWIKQTLKLRHFLGRSENAVRIQIIVALIAFVLIRLAYNAQATVPSPTHFGRLLRANILHRIPANTMGRNQTPPPTQTTATQTVLL